jgi:small conductance mechanosensitive channel
MLVQFQDAFQKLLAKLNSWLDGIVLALPNIILALLVLTGSVFVARYLKKGTQKTLFRATGNQTVVSVISNVIVAAFMLLSIFIVLSILNLDDAFTALLGTAGVIGLVVGLALQDPLTNLFSGILMSVRDKYAIGDLVETNGYFGTIQKINLRSTVIATPTGQLVVVPNKDVLQNPLVNFTRSGQRRVDLECGISYNDDLEEVQEVALDAVQHAGIELMEGRHIEVFFKEFGDSSINFVLRFWLKATPQRDYLQARSQAVIALKKAFDKNGITIPFPIRTLDFGIVGGVRLDDLYPSQKLSVVRGKNGGGRAEE